MFFLVFRYGYWTLDYRCIPGFLFHLYENELHYPSGLLVFCWRFLGFFLSWLLSSKYIYNIWILVILSKSKTPQGACQSLISACHVPYQNGQQICCKHEVKVENEQFARNLSLQFSQVTPSRRVHAKYKSS